MAEFTAREIRTATGALLTGEETKRFTGVVTDTRKIFPGALFIALVGERFDGHNFVAKALQQGAGGILVQHPCTAPANVPVFLVKNTQTALQQIARYHRRRFKIPVVAVTGSNGKTSTKDMIAAVLGEKMTCLKTEANFNNEIGLPLTLLQLTPQDQAAVVEMGMRGRGQLTALAAVAEPTIAVVTNVGVVHMELLGSIENIAAAKAELVTALPADGTAILNADDQRVCAMAAKTQAHVVTYGLSPDCDVRGEDVKFSARSVTVTVCWQGRKKCLHIPVPGRHNVYNALAAVAVGTVLGMSLEDAADGLARFAPTAMRLDIATIGRYTVINDAYNASPASMAAAIDTLCDVAQGRRVAVLGDMLELGPVSAAEHRKIGQLVTEKGIELLITVGEQAALIAETARTAGSCRVFSTATREEAGIVLTREMQPGDTLLFKASHSLHLERLLDLFKPIATSK